MQKTVALENRTKQCHVFAACRIAACKTTLADYLRPSQRGGFGQQMEAWFSAATSEQVGGGGVRRTVADAVGSARRMPGRGGRAVGPEGPHLAHGLGRGPVAPRASGTVRQGGSTVIQAGPAMRILVATQPVDFRTDHATNRSLQIEGAQVDVTSARSHLSQRERCHAFRSDRPGRGTVCG